MFHNIPGRAWVAVMRPVPLPYNRLHPIGQFLNLYGVV